MSKSRTLRVLSAAAFLSAGAFAASAQTSSQPPASPPAEKPPMAKPTTPPTSPAPQKPDKTSAAKKEAHPLVGRTALTSDGSKAGEIRTVKTGPDGKITAIQLKVGGFLGFGGKIVEVPEGKFTQKGDAVELAYTSDELSKLPEVKDAS